MTLKQEFNHYRPLLYVIVITIMLFQFYTIWQDRLEMVAWVTYSYDGGKQRNVSQCMVDFQRLGGTRGIRTTGDIVNAIDYIQERTKRTGVAILWWSNVEKTKEIVIDE